jgi:hypothetical protein
MAEAFDEAVGSVALQIDDLQKFRAQAAAVARQLGSAVVPALSTRLHSPPRPEPPGSDGGQRGLGGWLSAWQFAIFELFFEFGTAALPVLRQVAFGEYDWIQGNAVEVLVRLAAKGIEREQIIGELRREFPRFREEAQLYAVGHSCITRPETRPLPQWSGSWRTCRRGGRLQRSCGRRTTPSQLR